MTMKFLSLFFFILLLLPLFFVFFIQLSSSWDIDRAGFVENHETETTTTPEMRITGKTIGVEEAGISTRKGAIIELFLNSWDTYRRYAWGHDELLPLSKSGGDSRNGWGATIIDSLSTAIIMELDEVVLEALKFIDTIDFSKAPVNPTSINMFESTIRYLGGLLSSYDLLNDPAYSHLVPQNQKELVDRLLQQARTLGDNLIIAFKTSPIGIPLNSLNFVTKTTSPEKVYFDTRVSIAEVGTLVLEWTRLSDLTNDPKYGRYAARAEKYLLYPTPEPLWPGLIPDRLSAATGEFQVKNGGWGAGADSYFEYLLKMAIYSPDRFKIYGDQWKQAVESTIEHLLVPSANHEKTGGVWVANYDGEGGLEYTMGHLTCFIGGNMVQGGKALNYPNALRWGLKLVAGCWEAYQSTATKIAPEQWVWGKDSKGGEDFEPTITAYYLRPEVAESIYLAWKHTGINIYREWMWELVQAVNKHCRVESGGYAGLQDVTKPDGGGKLDMQESFWMAELPKYAFLTFENKQNGVSADVNGTKWVFNTEAHPLKVSNYVPI
jgi:mannosyl-oligosaccharide alpha-1,2-mannosidase